MSGAADPGAGGGFFGLSADARGCEVPAIRLGGAGGGGGEASNSSSGAQTLFPSPL